MDQIKERVALVTGASKGLGAAIAKKLASCGAKVAVNYLHDHKSAKKVVGCIHEKGGIANKFCYDITAKDAVKSLVEDIIKKFGTVDIVVNNATGSQPMMKIEKQNWKDHLNQLSFFVKAPLLLLKEVLPIMKEKEYGRIINIGSEVVELGNAKFGHYVAAKAAMLGLTRSWANELGPYGITCNLIAPGWIPVERHQNVSQIKFDKYLEGVPVGNLGTPKDMANAVLYLASDMSGFINGQKIAVNGGKTLC